MPFTDLSMELKWDPRSGLVNLYHSVVGGICDEDQSGVERVGESFSDSVEGIFMQTNSSY